MAYQTTWYHSGIPKSVVDLIEKETNDDSTIPEDSWIGGLVWHYILRANRENFCFNLSHLDGQSLKFKLYNEGDHQGWHTDAKPVEDEDKIRKISFTFQLSDYDDYEMRSVVTKKCNNLYEKCGKKIHCRSNIPINSNNIIYS